MDSDDGANVPRTRVLVIDDSNTIRRSAEIFLKQGGYDWGFLAYAVGFGGSMIWFGSSSGVALSNMYPEAKSVGAWIKGGWHVALGYVVGFFILLAVMGWHPEPKRSKAPVVPVGSSVVTPAVASK